MPKVDFDGVVGLERVLREKKSFGEHGTMPILDLEVVDLKERIINYYGDFFIKDQPSDKTFWVENDIWRVAQKLHKQLGFGDLKEDSGQYQDKGEELDLPNKNPLQWGRKTFFDIGGWKELGIDKGKIVDEDMSRHFLLLGETGSGKTHSGVKPLLKSILRYGDSDPDKTAAVLVIDPKSELKEFVEKELGNGRCKEKLKFLNLEKTQYRLHAFEGKDLQALTAYEILNTVLPLSETFLRTAKGSQDPYWTLHPRNIIEGVLDVLLRFERESDLEKDFWKELSECIEGCTDADKKQSQYLSYCRDNYFLPMKSFFSLAGGSQQKYWTAFKATCDRLKISQRLSSIADDMLSPNSNHYASLISMVNLFVRELCLPDLVKHVSLNPHEKPHKDTYISIKDAVEKGKILVYSPNTSSFISDAIGRLIKAQFFAATWDRKNKERPVAYVCDEFQRFITGDPESGEQSFLDRCRSYRAICVLATQSIASINKALHDTGESAVQDTVSIILNNTGTKLFFRNTDVDTQNRLKTLIPSNTLDNFHIGDVRPVSTLKVGECYYLLVDGRWGRGQVRLRSGSETQPSEINNAESRKQPDNPAFANPSMCPLLGEVNAESILSLCANIDQAVYYFQYRHITIEICSPGGSVLALEHFLNKLKRWRKCNVIFETVATIDTASAAAMMLSLGDIGHRKAYSSASLHYHYSRIQISGAVLTRADFDQRSASLSKTDDKFISELVLHVYDNRDARKLINLKKLYKTLKNNGSPLSLPSIGYEPNAKTDKPEPDPSLWKRSPEIYETVLRELFANDMPIRPEEAKLLGLIDEVIGEEEERIRPPTKTVP